MSRKSYKCAQPKISECKQKFKRTIQNIHISQSETFSYNQFCANFTFHSLQDTHTPTYTEQKRGSLQHWSMAEEKLSFQTGMLRVPKGRTWKKACARRVPKDTRQCSMWGQFRPDGKSGIKGLSSIIAHSPTNTVPFEDRARPPVSSEKQLHSFLFT